MRIESTIVVLGSADRYCTVYSVQLLNILLNIFGNFNPFFNVVSFNRKI